MDLTDVPDDIRESSEDPPDFDEWDDPEEVLKGGPIRERMLDVLLQLRTPTKVATIANRVECDTETARDYLEWFASMGMAREHRGRPVRYERNDSYFKWRRIEQLRDRYSEDELVDELTQVLEAIEDYRTRFDADTPDAVSLVDVSRDVPVEDAWEALSDWQTLERRAELLDAARRTNSGTGGGVGRIDA